MPELPTITVFGVLVLAALSVVYLKLRQKDLLGAMMQKRQGTAKLVTRAEYAEGAERIPVALSVTSDTLYYEAPDLDASFELARIDEVEYADDLVTGANLANGHHVLRLRAHGTAFEFVLEPGDEKKWMAVLPPHSIDNTPTAHAV
jgi:hypothetical protein